MTNLIKETLQAEVASLQAQLDLIEKQAERLKETLATYQSLLEEKDEVEIELVYEEEESPVEVKNEELPEEPAVETPYIASPEEIVEEEEEVEIELVYDETEDEDVPVEEPVLEVLEDSVASEETPATEEAEEPAEAEEEENLPDVEPEEEEEESIEEEVEEEPSKDLQSSPTGGNGKGASNLLPPISDIRKAISLGDRFLFQRELFANNGELMHKTIDKLNTLSSLEDALAYIYKNFDWNTESQAYELFINILKRRWQ